MAAGLIREGHMPYVNMGYMLCGSLQLLFETFLRMAKEVVFYSAVFMAS
jgi:hypothetical protein